MNTNQTLLALTERQLGQQSREDCPGYEKVRYRRIEGLDNYRMDLRQKLLVVFIVEE